LEQLQNAQQKRNVMLAVDLTLDQAQRVHLVKSDVIFLAQCGQELTNYEKLS
jgi:hypothetical protein